MNRVAGVILLLIMASAMAQPDQSVLLPDGFVYPAIVKPSVPAPGSRSCPGCRRLRSGPLVVAEKNLVYHTVNLDRSPGGWAGSLLTVEAGFGKPWSPELVYGLLPDGIEGQGDKLIVYLARRLLVFERRLDEAGMTVLDAVNAPGFTLERQGDCLVLSQAQSRRWYFESPDQGATRPLAGARGQSHPPVAARWRIARASPFTHCKSSRTALARSGCGV
ncbi:MAG: hypothetical protein A3K18_28240 [Lentisphaerae bacterium RIFOXYA12_64_32]|nr:MAG: hypothetical protein A3K18_28240 [Lentisphaerae bacterium RIFOXYA12_64_32]